MTSEEHNVLSQLAQLGLQRLAEIATSALQKAAPQEPEVSESDNADDRSYRET